MRLAVWSVATALLLAGATAAAAELRGHGGPVRAIAVTPEGAVITGSFDSRAIVWSLETGTAREVLLFHAGQVNAVAALPDGRFATGGADGRIAIWPPGKGVPARVLEAHGAPVAALAVSPDGAMLASASWDMSVRLWPLAEPGEPRVLEGHRGNVNAVGFLADGTPVSAGYDGNLIFWPREAGAAPVTFGLGAPLNALAALPGELVAVGGADGGLRVLDRSGTVRAQAQVASGPVVALAVSPDGSRLAAAGLDGGVAVLAATSLAPTRGLAGAGAPVWSLAFAPDGETLLIGGADGVVREWNVASGELLGAANGADDPMAEFAGNPDAEAFRACVACHTLDPDDGNRAGPTLHGLFGRRIASVPGYRYSPALRGMDIVWTPETVAKLFELGPHAFTPGTKMPEQRIGDAEERAALIRFLRSATGQR